MKNPILALLGFAALIGCGSANSSDGPPAQPLTADQQMKNIQDDPHMTPAARAQAQAAIAKGQAMGQGMQSHPQK